MGHRSSVPGEAEFRTAGKMKSATQMAVSLCTQPLWGKCRALFRNTAYSLLIHIVSVQEPSGRDVELFILESG